MTFEKHLRSDSRAASQRLGILRSPGECSIIDHFLGDTFRVLSSQLVRQYELLDRAVGGARFVTGGVFECNIAHRRSVVVLCMLYKIGCNPMYTLNCALPGPNVPVRVTRGALVAHRFTYAPPRCKTSQYNRTFIPLSVSLWNDLANHVFDGVGQAGFKSRANAFLLA